MLQGSVGFDKCIALYSRDSIIEKGFTALKMPMHHLFIPPALPPNPWHWSFYCLQFCLFQHSICLVLIYSESAKKANKLGPDQAALGSELYLELALTFWTITAMQLWCLGRWAAPLIGVWPGQRTGGSRSADILQWIPSQMWYSNIPLLISIGENIIWNNLSLGLNSISQKTVCVLGGGGGCCFLLLLCFCFFGGAMRLVGS